MAKSLNRVQLIGNLTRDPELRYTPQGTAVCSFGLATNRQWSTDEGKKEDVEFHRIVAWQKLAEICAQLLTKGRKAYVEGRLQTRRWTGQDGVERTTTEIVISDMILLDSKFESSQSDDFDIPDEDFPSDVKDGKESASKNKGKSATSKKQTSKKTTKKKKSSNEVDNEEDIPF